MVNVNGYYRTVNVVSVEIGNMYSTLTIGTTVNILAVDYIHSKILILYGIRSTWVDLNFLDNLIKIG